MRVRAIHSDRFVCRQRFPSIKFTHRCCVLMVVVVACAGEATELEPSVYPEDTRALIRPRMST
jgi:hypothetical protein